MGTCPKCRNRSHTAKTNLLMKHTKQKYSNYLSLHESTQQLFHGGTQIVLITNLFPSLSQHLDSFGEFQAERRIQKCKRFRWILAVDGWDFLHASTWRCYSSWYSSRYPHNKNLLALQSAKNFGQNGADRVQHFVVMRVEGHLQIQTHKLSQVTVGIAVFSSENCHQKTIKWKRSIAARKYTSCRSKFQFHFSGRLVLFRHATYTQNHTGSYSVDFLEVGCNGHLFVKLRRLSQIGRSFEVRNSEYVGSSFTCCGNNFRGVDFNEVLGSKPASSIKKKTTVTQVVNCSGSIDRNIQFGLPFYPKPLWTDGTRQLECGRWPDWSVYANPKHGCPIGSLGWLEWPIHLLFPD